MTFKSHCLYYKRLFSTILLLKISINCAVVLSCFPQRWISTHLLENEKIQTQLLHSLHQLRRFKATNNAKRAF